MKWYKSEYVKCISVCSQSLFKGLWIKLKQSDVNKIVTSKVILTKSKYNLFAVIVSAENFI